jgi:antitoxin component of MazEF toxin-antitoxin module
MAIKVKRQVREIGGSFFVCLPKYWALDAGIVKNQPVVIELTDEHSIRVIAPEVQK